MAGVIGRVDGRVLRGRRNREAVVTSFVALLEEGDLKPTGRSIAARAGVSLRSVFQHFEDLEQIFAEAGQLEARKVRHLLEPVDSRLPIGDRLDAFVAQRRQLLEAVDAVARAARLREPFSAQLQANRDHLLRAARRQCEKMFAPEIKPLRGPARTQMLDAVTTASSWSTWYHLTENLGMDGDRAAGVMHLTLSRLLVPAP